MRLFLAFLIVPLIEIALFIQVGGLIGLWPTLGVVVLTAILGTWLVRTQGALAMGNLRRSFSELNDPTEPLAHGAMILLAGALLLTPGFFTDGVGFALLVPSVRHAAYEYLRKRIRVERFEMGRRPSPDAPPRRPHPSAPHATRPRQPDVVEGEYEVLDEDFAEMDPPKPPTHRPSGWTRH